MVRGDKEEILNGAGGHRTRMKKDNIGEEKKLLQKIEKREIRYWNEETRYI